jgi:hypothetical protein
MITMTDPQTPQATVTVTTVLGFTVIAAIVTTVGTLIGLVLKERVFSRSFERWRNQLTLENVERKYRDPIVLAGLELCNRLQEICDEFPTDFLSSTLLAVAPAPAERTAVRDHYFRCYKLQSSVYRLAAFLGWLELYRQELVFLDSRSGNHNPRAELAITNIRADLADGHLNAASDWHNWTDTLLFREEQRAVGEVMIVGEGSNRVVRGYAEFSLLYADESLTGSSWISAVRHFFLDPEPPQDFRLIRLKRLHLHIVDLVGSIDPKRLRSRQIEARVRYCTDLGLPT